MLLILALLIPPYARGAEGDPPPVPLQIRPRAEEPWSPAKACPPDEVSPRDYNRCLYDAFRTSEQALEAEVANAMAIIDARADLAPVQRARWRNLLDEAQSRFLIFRNFDCQSVAPFEGPRGIGNFVQRNLCLIDTNAHRVAELRRRYGTLPVAREETASGPEYRPGTWSFRMPPPVN